MRVLIIEDDRGMVELLRKGLEEENHVVSAAFDGVSVSSSWTGCCRKWMVFASQDACERATVPRRFSCSRLATRFLIL